MRRPPGRGLGCKNEYTVLAQTFFLGGLLEVWHAGSVVTTTVGHTACGGM